MANRKFYTFSEIVGNIITRIGTLAPGLNDFTPGSNLRAIVDAFSYFVEFLQYQINVAFEAFTIRGAIGVDLDNRVQDFGLSRKPAVAARGIIQFSRTTQNPSTFTVNAGGQVSTQPDIFGSTIDYTLDESIIFPAGATSVTGYVTCTTPGIVGNQPSGTVINITSFIPGIDTVENIEDFTNGADTETDEELRRRVPTHINGLKAGNESAIMAAALSVDGITVSRVDEGVPGPGQITVYITNQYSQPTQQQIDEVRRRVEDACAFGISTNIATPTRTNVIITLDLTYDAVNYKSTVIDQELKNSLDRLISTSTGTTLKIVDVILTAMAIAGVKNVKNVKIDGVATDKEVSSYGVIRLADKNTSITATYIKE